ncbi:hypothetical protein DFA_04314 [Cavenderia fasciculata]|uniref:Uncharacterized protein n=1 Tax=Cavenderia fasciculata TaxID=261658 RepID=F4PP83_CACFS|nr:uncharacterized protein DFA_04314 [Cavenderia fasciculata]EGG22196.1 hypothetical protein DFA_04314 [Cavenderia fasciculata]|eukprot:XP_004360047.1 hypothetical protein DFA_04314 [Cavenderia fasciculata]
MDYKERKEIAIKSVLHSTYLLRNIRRWIKLINRISTRELIKTRLQIVPEYDRVHNSNVDRYYKEMLRHPNLMCKTFNQANSVMWLLKNGFHYLLRDKIRAGHELTFDGNWMDLVTRETLYIFIDEEIERLVKQYFGSIKDHYGAHLGMLEGAGRSGDHRMVTVAHSIITKFNFSKMLYATCYGGNIYSIQFVLKYATTVERQNFDMCLYNMLLSGNTAEAVEYLITLLSEDKLVRKYNVQGSHDYPDIFDRLLKIGDVGLIRRLVKDLKVVHYEEPRLEIYAFGVMEDIMQVTSQQIQVLSLAWVELGSHKLKASHQVMESRFEKEIPIDWIGTHKERIVSREQLLNILTAFELILEIYKFPLYNGIPTQSTGEHTVRLAKFSRLIVPSLAMIMSLSGHQKVAEYIGTHLGKLLDIDQLFYAACQSDYIENVYYYFPMYQLKRQQQQLQQQQKIEELKKKKKNLVNTTEKFIPPTTSKLDIFLFLSNHFKYETVHDLMLIINAAIKVGNVELVRHVIHTNILVLTSISLDIIFNSCNIEIATFLLSVYYHQKTIRFSTNEFDRISGRPKTAYFIVRNFIQLQAWMYFMTFDQGYYDQVLCKLALFLNRPEVFSVFMPRSVPTEFCFGGSPEAIKKTCLRVSRYGSGEIISTPDTWETIGEIGSTDLLDLVMANHKESEPVLSRVVKGAFKASNHALIIHVESKYYKTYYTMDNITEALNSNCFKILFHYFEKNRSSRCSDIVNRITTILNNSKPIINKQKQQLLELLNK